MNTRKHSTEKIIIFPIYHDNFIIKGVEKRGLHALFPSFEAANSVWRKESDVLWLTMREKMEKQNSFNLKASFST